jgi:pseudoazurin
MKSTLSRRSLGLGLALLLSGIAAPAMAETHIVKMYTFDAAVSDQADFFDPPLIQVAVGDTVKFEATQSGHNTASKKGMIPEGAESWNSPMDVDFEITFTADGTYGYICSPHYSVGMVGLVLVGDYKTNLDQVRKVKHRGKAKKAFRALFKEVDAIE